MLLSRNPMIFTIKVVIREDKQRLDKDYESLVYRTVETDHHHP